MIAAHAMTISRRSPFAPLRHYGRDASLLQPHLLRQQSIAHTAKVYTVARCSFSYRLRISRRGGYC